MRFLLRTTILAAALFAASSFIAVAQTTIVERSGYVQLSPSQRVIIQRHVVREPRVMPRPRVELRVGAPVPPAVELYPLPDEVYVEVPAMRPYRYVYVENEVVLVDPETNEIVEIIRD
jgi:hypothetical protein